MSSGVKILIFLLVIMLLSLISTGLEISLRSPFSFVSKFCKTIYFAMLTLIYESPLKKCFCNNGVGNSTFICELTSPKCAKFPKKTFG